MEFVAVEVAASKFEVLSLIIGLRKIGPLGVLIEAELLASILLFTNIE